ncbi:hypothetical protein RND81_09G213400 [Saponaria officinalis]|uniref:HTH myb-type domain-containing protein n=1 Tax=Saponaria officinalis TaxID=3572 RepID=A0AAW1INT1_SAPOF
MESNWNDCMADLSIGDQQPKERQSSSNIFVPKLAIPQQLSVPSAEVSASANSTSAYQSNTPRMRWTQELHEAFTDAVSHLGGCENASVEGILQLMNVEGLTIYHVKTHLQKYRTARARPQSSEGNSDDKPTDIEHASPVDLNTSITMTKALRMQMKMQKQLHEQLEIQRKLHLQIEERGKYLLQMLDSQNKPEDNFPCKADSDAYDLVSLQAGADTNVTSQALAETSNGSKGKRQVLESSNGADQCREADESAPPPMKCPRTDNSLQK